MAKTTVKKKKEPRRLFRKLKITKKVFPMRVVLTETGKKQVPYAKLFAYEKGKKALNELLKQDRKTLPNPQFLLCQDYEGFGNSSNCALSALNLKEKNRHLGTSELETVSYWFKKTSSRERREFKKKHPNPEKELKKIERATSKELDLV